MNAFDIISLLVLVWAIISGWRSGLVSQILGLLGVGAGILLGIKFGTRVGLILGLDASIAPVLGFVVTFICVYILAFLGSRILRGTLRFIGLHSVDIIMGIALSCIKWFLLLSFAYSAFATLNQKWDIVEKNTIESSISFKPVSSFADRLLPYVEKAKDKLLKQ